MAENKALAALVKLAEKQIDLELKLEKNAEDRKALNKELEAICGGWQSEGLLPAAMQEAELSSFTLEDGTVISCDEELQMPSLAAKSKWRETVIAWLKKEKHDDIIKREANIQFAKDDKRLKPIQDFLEKSGVPFSLFESANAATFKALVNELLESGKSLPMDELGIFLFRQTKVKK